MHALTTRMHGLALELHGLALRLHDEFSAIIRRAKRPFYPEEGRKARISADLGRACGTGKVFTRPQPNPAPQPMPENDPPPARYGDPRLTWDMPGLFWDGPVPAEALIPPAIMADNQTRQISPANLKEDQDAVTAIEALTTYAPQNSAFAVVVMKGTAANSFHDGLDAMIVKAGQDLVIAEAAAAAKRDAKVALEWNRHNWVVGARGQVASQYGESSDELASTGVKKKSEYKKPGPRKPKTPTP